MLLLKGHASGKAVNALAFSPDGNVLATAANDDVVCLWDLAEGGKPRKIPGYAGALVFLRDGERLVRSAGIGLIEVIDLGGKVLHAVNPDIGYNIRLALSADGSLLAAASYRFQLFDTRTWEPRLKAPSDGECTGAVAFLPRDNTLVTDHAIRNPRGRIRHVIRLWVSNKVGHLASLLGHTQDATALAASPDGRTLAGACGQYLCAWDLASGKMVLSHKPGALHFKDVAFAPDGRHLAVASNDKTVRLWDTATWRQAAAYDWDVGRIRAVAFSPDGMRAAGGGHTGRVVVWDIDL